MLRRVDWNILLTFSKVTVPSYSGTSILRRLNCFKLKIETSVTICHSKRLNISGDLNLQQHLSQDLKTF
jgi:hypothetical protein